MGLIEELKRRNVFRVGIAYGISAWVVLQVVDLVLDNTATPEWVMHVFMLLAVLGFILALVLAWAFELTPEGIKREKDVVRDESITPQAGHKLNIITLAAAALVIVLLALDRMLPQTPAPGAVSSQARMAQQQTGVSGTEAADSAVNLLPSPTADADGLVPGVAVLPFDNLSAEAGSEFFAGGVYEDVLTHLSHIGGLRIISRTSMQRIAERGLDVREIGRQLGVSHVLEGSVRRAGEQVRVTVQLIDAATDEHLWAENFDRTLDDIFAIQSEIARSIAAQLETELSPEAAERINAVPTNNLAAYELYLQAREQLRTWRGAVGFEQQRVLLEQAVALDPGFLDALVMLANAYGRLVWTGADTTGEFRQKAQSLVQTIETRWPEQAQAQLARANYVYNVERDYEGALQRLLALLPQMPNNIDILMGISSSYKRTSRGAQGLPYARQALLLDPENSTVAFETVFNLFGSGEIEAALQAQRERVSQFPDVAAGLSFLAFLELAVNGDKDAALALGQRREKLLSMPPWPVDAVLELQEYYRLRLASAGHEAAVAALDTIGHVDEPVAWSWAQVQAQGNAAELLTLAGQPQAARERAARALAALEAKLSAGAPLPGNQPQLWYAGFSRLACLAGDQAAYNRHSAVAAAMNNQLDGREQVAGSLMFAKAECGDIKAAWAMLPVSLNRVLGEQDHSLALDPIYPHYFGRLPEYQALVARLPER